jgi:organic radical activating enzyme
METPMPTAKVTTVNFHLVKHCPMACNFCYARFDDVIRDTKVSTLGLPTEQARKVVAELAGLGFEKINFAGGEPLLRKDLPELIRYAKSLGLVTSIISNGQLITADWIKAVYGHLDQIGISVDSALPERRVLMGRAIKGKSLSNADYLDRATLIRMAHISLKINSVVTAQNFDEDMNAFIQEPSALLDRALEGLFGHRGLFGRFHRHPERGIQAWISAVARGDHDLLRELAELGVPRADGGERRAADDLRRAREGARRRRRGRCEPSLWPPRVSLLANSM